MLVGGVSLWAIAVAVGAAILIRYEGRPGTAQAAPTRWPAESRLSPKQPGGTLVVFVHPQCPCSRATMAEVEKLAADSVGRLRIETVFVLPEGAPKGFEQGALWNLAGAIPGVERRVDLGMAEARRFGAETSGDAILYDERGQIVFEGGLTFSRGHEGDNAGVDAVLNWVLHKSALHVARRTAVFGCPLQAAGGENSCRK